MIYRNVFTEDTILDFEIDREKIKQELDYRYLHKIPPGFKDESKSDDGIGDFLIWLAIIEVAKTKKNVVFVSGDEKTDWFHKSEKQALYPRFELINEFAFNSGGKSFHIIRLSELLNLLGADEKAVKEVEIEEKVNVTSYDEFRLFGSQAERAVFNWLLLRDDLGVRPNSIGYPDFEVTYDDGTKSGVEVIPINENRNSISISLRIKEKMFRAYYEIKEKRFDKIQFVFVAVSSNYNFGQLNNSLEKSTNGFDKGSIEFVFGHLNEQSEFIRTN